MTKNYNSYITTILSFLIITFNSSCTKKKDTVFINTPKLLAGYEATKKAQKELQSKIQKWNAQLDTLSKSLESEIQKFEKERPTLSEKELKLSKELLTARQQQLIQYQQSISKMASEEEQKMKSGVLSEMNAFISEYGKKHSFEYILGTTNSGNIIYADPENDITESVLKELNEDYRKQLH